MRGVAASAAEERIVAMNSQMQHRGPDAHGVFVDGNLALGHRRLKIIDLEGGVQPMFDADERIVVVFNGEIYNYIEIRAELEKKGHRFRTNSDTEVIIQAYIEHGEQCVELFRGMFTIALYDRDRRKLVLLRDRLGIKPLYYYLDDRQLLFASEIKAILKVLDARPEADISALDFYLTVGYVPGETTLFANIRKLPPGHCLRLQDGEYEIYSYWDLEDVEVSTETFEDAMSHFEALACESVALRMRSDVPFGAFLSGGLDSSFIVALMSRHSNKPISTFSVGYRDDPESNELGYARLVADHLGTDHHEYILDPLDFFDSLDLLLEHMEEPVVESAAVALYQLSRLAKEHVTVILSGEGGDEVLAGYPLHRIMPRVDQISKAVRPLPGFIKTAISHCLSGNEKLMKYWDWASEPLAQRYRSISNDVTSSIKHQMYQSTELKLAHENNLEYYSRLFDRLARSTDLRKMTYVDIKTWLPDDLLVKADKMTMAASLELRVPFLDHKLLEYATALPDTYRLNGDSGKYLLKKLAETYLPQEIIYRQKKGFPVPIASWFRDTLYGRVQDILLDNRTLSRNYFRREYIEKLLVRHRHGRQDLSRRIFSLLNIELWHRKYIDH